MGSKRGLGDASLTRGPSQRAGFVAALQRVSSESVVEWDVQRVGVNPYNPVRRSSRVEWLALSVASKGLLEPLLVVSVQAWLAAHPEHEGVIAADTVDYVVVNGHRRLAAARIAGIATVPCLVRDELAVDDEETILHTGVHQLTLTPIEQGRAFARMVDRGLSQREIAGEVGVAQGQVSKRLALLKLPESIQEAVDLDLYPVRDALEFLAETKDEPEVLALVGERVAALLDGPLPTVSAEDGLSPDETADHIQGVLPYGSRLPNLLLGVRGEIRDAAAAAAAAAEAERLGVEVVRPAERFGYQSTQHAVSSQAEIEAAKKDGSLVVGVDPYRGEGFRYYTTKSTTARKPDKVKAARREFLEARKGRGAWVAKLASRRPSASEYRDAATALAMSGMGSDYKTRNAAIEFCQAKGWPFADWQHDLAGADAERYTWALWAFWQQGVVDNDDSMNRPWKPLTITWMEQMIAAGYDPAAWDARKLAEARASQVKSDDDASNTPEES